MNGICYENVYRVIGYDLEGKQVITEWVPMKNVRLDFIEFLEWRANQCLKNWQFEYDVMIKTS